MPHLLNLPSLVEVEEQSAKRRLLFRSPCSAPLNSPCPAAHSPDTTVVLTVWRPTRITRRYR